MDTYIRFRLGQPIRHKKHAYRGVIIDSDAEFSQSDVWYQLMTNDFPAKNRPWYYILVNDSSCVSYVPESYLEPDLSGDPINHPMLAEYFNEFTGGLYKKEKKTKGSMPTPKEGAGKEDQSSSV